MCVVLAMLMFAVLLPALSVVAQVLLASAGQRDLPER